VELKPLSEFKPTSLAVANILFLEALEPVSRGEHPSLGECYGEIYSNDGQFLLAVTVQSDGLFMKWFRL